jgi:hypothetical protein
MNMVQSMTVVQRERACLLQSQLLHLCEVRCFPEIVGMERQDVAVGSSLCDSTVCEWFVFLFWITLAGRLFGSEAFAKQTAVHVTSVCSFD